MRLPVGDDKCSLLVVDDEPFILSTLAALLSSEFEVLTADCAAAAKELFTKRQIDLILTDQKMPRTTGVQLLEWVREHHPKTIRLLMTGFAELEEAVQAINRAQVFRYLFKPWRPEELLASLRDAAHSHFLERSNEQLLRELEDRVAQRTRELEEANHELEQKNEMLDRLAVTDPLTGLLNRRGVDRVAERELRRREGRRYANGKGYGCALAIGLIDADHFKEINAHYLHSGGDKVLVDLSRALNGSLRAVDFLGRVGGEEFLVIAPETNMEGAVVLGERIRTTVESFPFSYQEQTIQVRVSLGFAVAELGERADYDLMKHVAAAALKNSKDNGRNRCTYYSVARRPFDEAVRNGDGAADDSGARGLHRAMVS